MAKASSVPVKSNGHQAPAKPARTVALVGALVLAGLLTGCAQPAAAPSPQPAGEPGRVTATLGEMYIKLSQNSAPAGTVTFSVKNEGVIAHEMLVLKTDLAEDKLPARSDDPSRVQESGPGIEAVGEVHSTDLPPGASQDLTLQLERGKYLLICNIAGHYLGGMHAAFTVT